MSNDKVKSMLWLINQLILVAAVHSKRGNRKFPAVFLPKSSCHPMFPKFPCAFPFFTNSHNSAHHFLKKNGIRMDFRWKFPFYVFFPLHFHYFTPPISNLLRDHLLFQVGWKFPPNFQGSFSHLRPKTLSYDCGIFLLCSHFS